MLDCDFVSNLMKYISIVWIIVLYFQIYIIVFLESLYKNSWFFVICIRSHTIFIGSNITLQRQLLLHLTLYSEQVTKGHNRSSDYIKKRYHFPRPLQNMKKKQSKTFMTKTQKLQSNTCFSEKINKKTHGERIKQKCNRFFQ